MRCGAPDRTPRMREVARRNSGDPRTRRHPGSGKRSPAGGLDAGPSATARGIFGDHFSVGDIDIDVRNATIVTESTVAHSSLGYTASHGIHAFQRSLGNVDIDVRGGSIETRGTYSYGGIIKLADRRLFSAFLHEAKPLKSRKAAIDNIPEFRSESG